MLQKKSVRQAGGKANDFPKEQSYADKRREKGGKQIYMNKNLSYKKLPLNSGDREDDDDDDEDGEGEAGDLEEFAPDSEDMSSDEELDLKDGLMESRGKLFN